MATITSLPVELLEKILASTNGITLLRCRSVCKQLKTFIDENDTVWKVICEKEIKLSSRIAKKKCGDELTWFEIYRNIKKWALFPDAERCMRKFYHFVMHDKCHAIDIEYNVLPLRENRGFILYDMKTMKYMPVVMPEKSCMKMSHNQTTSVAQFKNCIIVQRNEEKSKQSEALFKADKFVLTDSELYYFNNRDVYKTDLKSNNLDAKLIHHCDYDLSEIQYSDSTVHLFTDCGKIVSIKENSEIKVTAVKCPEEWIKRIKHIIPLDHQNYISYSRNLFKIKANDYEHLYLEFPTITALFFYGEIILLATKAGEILLYRLASQKQAKKPVFEKLAVLPENNFAVTLDLYERKRGPMIVASTWFDVFVIDVNLFSEEECLPTKRLNPMSKLHLYKRLMKLKERVRNMKF